MKQSVATADGVASLAKAEKMLRHQAEAMLQGDLQQDLGIAQHDVDDSVPRVTMTQRPLDYKRTKQREAFESADTQASLKYTLMQNPTSELARLFLQVCFP